MEPRLFEVPLILRAGRKNVKAAAADLKFPHSICMCLGTHVIRLPETGRPGGWRLDHGEAWASLGWSGRPSLLRGIGSLHGRWGRLQMAARIWFAGADVRMQILHAGELWLRGLCP